ncbi:unnamed protein product [Eruca vesicaria subsp. sativa]|uniref:Uncharacterized protein n=1 Tax=Eruca vesicaria subsp. sativa TaxID=29727 RepID=A0ABC8JZF5_ERUVS|nr:unnamed protein product [Eruca vesicaria subsp. sativa]
MPPGTLYKNTPSPTLKIITITTPTTTRPSIALGRNEQLGEGEPSGEWREASTTNVSKVLLTPTPGSVTTTTIAWINLATPARIVVNCGLMVGL